MLTALIGGVFLDRMPVPPAMLRAGRGSGRGGSRSDYGKWWNYYNYYWGPKNQKNTGYNYYWNNYNWYYWVVVTKFVKTKTKTSPLWSNLKLKKKNGEILSLYEIFFFFFRGGNLGVLHNCKSQFRWNKNILWCCCMCNLGWRLRFLI